MSILEKILFSALAAAAASAAAPAAAAAEWRRDMQRVQVRDLDLTTVQGEQELNRRIARAAKGVCRRTATAYMSRPSCRRAVIADTAPAAIAAIYAARPQSIADG